MIKLFNFGVLLLLLGGVVAFVFVMALAFGMSYLVSGFRWLKARHIRNKYDRGVWNVDPDHPSLGCCTTPECMDCGYRDCPYAEPLHYHHDGCPACTAMEKRK